MVPEAQQPVMRDFMGLGKLAANDNRLTEADGSTYNNEPFRFAPGFLSGSINMNMHSTGEKQPMPNISSGIEHNLSERKNLVGRYQEESAESFGLSCRRQWPGMGSNASARINADTKPSPMQLTIFYGGHVNVYNNISSENAEAIMHLAAKGDPLPATVAVQPIRVSHTYVDPGFSPPTTAAENLPFNTQMGDPILFAADETSEISAPGNKWFDCAIPNTPSTATSPQPVVPRALPLARKASLARFLEKRKERMQMMSPYFKKQIAHGKQNDGLLQNVSLPNQVYSQYFTRPTMVYRMQEQADMSSNGISAKQ